MTTPETLDYLAVAKANWNAVPGLDGTPEHGMSAAQTCALVSIAESMAVLAGDLREERLRTESLRGALVEARREVDEAAELIDRVWKITNSDGTDIARIAAIHEAVTQ
ncbi:MAG: hypothetical protein IPJ61_20875 [Tessaracoccus sp.]|uniref:hypothetical protein n=1 Tax=Tessaracoccus sp. TaxID=1971211 RepID=UPI001ECEBCAA|nr:hypothetical protein [Tessaracoccus sp.]MBK7823444.1 hypothetical protein [Tessaracoccus sp.]